MSLPKNFQQTVNLNNKKDKKTNNESTKEFSTNG